MNHKLPREGIIPQNTGSKGCLRRSWPIHWLCGWAAVTINFLSPGVTWAQCHHQSWRGIRHQNYVPQGARGRHTLYSTPTAWARGLDLLPLATANVHFLSRRPEPAKGHPATTANSVPCLVPWTKALDQPQKGHVSKVNHRTLKMQKLCQRVYFQLFISLFNKISFLPVSQSLGSKNPKGGWNPHGVPH